MNRLTRTDSGTEPDNTETRSWPPVDVEPEPYQGPPRNIGPINELKWADNLQPRKYEIFGTHKDSKILFLDVNILDSTGREPFRGDVLIEGSFHLMNIWLWRSSTDTGEQGSDSQQSAKYQG